MDWSSIAHLVAPFAPKLGTALGAAFGSVGSIVGSVIGTGIAAAIGVAPSPAAVGSALQGDPQAGERLAALDQEALIQQAQVAIEALKQETERQRIAAEDKANARGFAAQLPATNPQLAAAQRRLAYITAITFFVMLVLLFARPEMKISEGAMLALGVLLGMAKDVWGFFFGSSAGSQAKDATIQTQAAVTASVAPPAPLAAVKALAAKLKR